MDDEPKKKRTKLKKLVDQTHCLFCDGELLDSGQVIHNPTQLGLNAIWNVACTKKDKFYTDLLPFKDNILSLKLKVKFHSSCRGSYMYNKSNEKQDTVHDKSDDVPNENTRMKREDTLKFDIRRDCFICSSHNKRTRNGKVVPLTQIAVGSGETTHQKLLKAANERNDAVIRHRMTVYHDLFALDAKYHRVCYSHYISERNITAAQNKVRSKEGTGHEKEQNPPDEAFRYLTSEIDTLLLEQNNVIQLSVLLEKYIQYYKDANNGEVCKYKSWKLKIKLKTFYEQKICFIERAGKTDLVCNSCMSVGETLSKMSKLEEGNHKDDDDEEVNVDIKPSERMVLHQAAGILRGLMKNKKDSDFFVICDSIDTNVCKSYISDAIYDFFRWCIDDCTYFSPLINEVSQDIHVPTLALCHNLIAQSKNVRTPLTLGLGVFVHHEFGSKKLIDILYSLGYSCSYDDIRRFETSVAKCQLVPEGDVFIPSGIKEYDEHNINSILDAAIDNFDNQEETIDGKNTTHDTVVVLYQRTVPIKEELNIPVGIQKTLTQEESDISDKIQRYDKPHIRPEPPEITDETWLTVNNDEKSYIQSQTKDQIWELSRAVSDLNGDIPSWGGFNALTSTRNLPVATVSYLPFVGGSSSDVFVIYTALLNLVHVAEKNGQTHMLVTADLAIYSKALQILWSKPALLSGKITMRLGGMHLTMAFLASIGTLFGDGGLCNLLTIPGIYADVTAKSLLQGKQLNRGVRAIKIVLEALTHLFMEAAESWAKSNDMPWLDNATKEHLVELQSSCKSRDSYACVQSVEVLEEDLSRTKFNITLAAFSKAGSEFSHTFKFWLNFMNSAHILLRLLRSERDGDFELHLNATIETIPYFILGGRHNYAKYTPIYVADMKRLEKDQPVMYNHMKNGGFVVRRTSCNVFNAVSTDQALEQTINKDAKTTGGIAGFSLKKSAVQKWFLNRHVTGKFASSFREMCVPTSDNGYHKELGTSRIVQDIQDVKKILTVIEDLFQNPFDIETIPSELINISTGKVATAEVQQSLSNIPINGDKLLQHFVEKRLSSSRTVSYWQTQSKTKIKTFNDMKNTSSIQNKAMVLDTEVLFRRLIVVSKNRDIDMQHVLSHELAAVPPSLFNDDGTMRKTAKSDMAKCLEKNSMEVYKLPSAEQPTKTVYIIDAMSVIQSLNEIQFRTFNDLGRVIKKKILGYLFVEDVDSVVIVFDRYDAVDSIKSQERQRRQGNNAIQTHIISGNRDVPNYRQFLKAGGNKAALSDFICGYLETNLPSELTSPLYRSKEVILSGGYKDGKIAKRINGNEVTELEFLNSSQEEADTRLILHAIDLAPSHNRIVVKSDDTDVLILLLYYHSKDKLSDEVFMHAGHASKVISRERFIPVHIISQKIGKTVCASLPAAHALTGCDSTSGIYGIGKSTVYKVLINNAEELSDLETYATLDQEDALRAARKFALLLYGKRALNCLTLDELRYKVATTTDKSAALLPPTEDAFQLHAMRAQFQCMVWCQSHVAMPNLPSPKNYGWKIRNGNLECVFVNKEPAPSELREITHLHCSDKQCETDKCQCKRAGLLCISACGCNENCPNVKKSVSSQSNDDSTSDSGDED